MIIVALLASAVGFFALAASMNRHAPALTGRLLTTRIRMVIRGFGGLALASSLAASAAAWGLAWGFIGWWGVLTAGAAITLLTLTLRSRERPAPRAPKS